MNTGIARIKLGRSSRASAASGKPRSRPGRVRKFIEANESLGQLASDRARRPRRRV
jgi:hypothetical protein